MNTPNKKQHSTRSNSTPSPNHHTHNEKYIKSKLEIFFDENPIEIKIYFENLVE